MTRTLAAAWLLAWAAGAGGAAVSGNPMGAPRPPPEGRVVVEASLGDLSGDGWHAQGLSAALDSPRVGRAGGRIRIARLTLPAPIGTLTDLTVRCETLAYDRQQLSCRDGYIDPGPAGHGVRSLRGDVRYAFATRTITADLEVEHTEFGLVPLKAELNAAGWSLSAELHGTPLDALVTTLARPASPAIAGELDLKLHAQGQGAGYQVRFSGAARGVAISNPEGTLASDALNARFQGEAQSKAASPAITFAVRLDVPQGEAYVEPIYVNLTDHPAILQTRGRLDGDTITLQHLALSLREVITAHSDGEVSLRLDRDLGRWRVVTLPLTYDQMVFPGAYEVLLQPFLAGTDLDDLETTGKLAGTAQIVEDQLGEVQVRLQDVHAEDRTGHLAVYGLDGHVARLADGRLQPYRVAFDGGFVYGISFGAQAVDFAERDAGPGWRLASAVDVPVLDGQLHLERLDFAPGADTDAPPTIALDARLTQVGMRAIAAAFGWPPLAGTLSGRIPSVTYENGDIAIAGTLEAQVFGGSVAITGLRVREPFGDRAIARGDVRWQQLDLEELSSTFSFGRMTGRVDGHLNNLVLLNWSPLRFDAALHTSPGDRSRHRISQRAVDNLTSLGGGGGAGSALSSSFLRFFEEFAYDELRLGCRLEDAVCQMSGLEPVTDDTGRPAYLVLRGRGLPRLSVVGHSTRVDWPLLLAQLRSITDANGEVSIER